MPKAKFIDPPLFVQCIRGDACVNPHGPWLPATEEFFYKRTGKRFRLAGVCKACEAHRKRSPEYKAYEKQKNRSPERLAYLQSPKIKLQRKQYRQRPEVKLRLQAYEKTEKRKQWLKEYAQTPKRKSRNKTSQGHLRSKIGYQRRMARKHNKPSNFCSSDWIIALNYFRGCCAVCGRQPGLWHTLSADHWIPLTAPNCPGTIPTNIIPLCFGIDGCNNSKCNRDPIEWLNGKFGQRKAASKLKEIQDYFSFVNEAARLARTEDQN